MEKVPSSLKSQPTLLRALFHGAVLILIDAVILNQGVISMVVGLWLVILSFPRTFLEEKFKSVRPQRVRNLSVYLSAVVLVFVFNAVNNSIAQSRAEMLVSAVKAFNAKNQRYPESLQELVPDYVQEVPVAKYTLISSKFWYSASNDNAMLFYMKMPPFGRQ
jgi:predicted PurR-regulated permease PerM